MTTWARRGRRRSLGTLWQARARQTTHIAGSQPIKTLSTAIEPTLRTRRRQAMIVGSNHSTTTMLNQIVKANAVAGPEGSRAGGGV
jgi:hypothetical protein